MALRRHTTYTLEHYEREHDTEHVFPLPFDPEGDPEHVYIAPNGLKAVLAYLVPDDSPGDPFEEFDEGEFVQFNSDYVHHGRRPSFDEFRRIVRANPGRVFTVCTAGDGYSVDAGPFTVTDTRGHQEGDAVTDQAIEDAAGYYVAPDDAGANYAEGAIETYSAYCRGDVYGVCVWVYTRNSIADPWDEPDRDAECWGYYGYQYAAEELQQQFMTAAAPDGGSI